MPTPEKRHSFRDSLLMSAHCVIRDTGTDIAVKLRNISAQGLMAEGPHAPPKDALVALELRNLGWVEGRVAWVQGNRFGILFTKDIDPGVIRQQPAAPPPASPHMLRRPLAVRLRQIETNPDALRRI